MRFGEITGLALLTVLLASGILLVDRIAPQQVTQPTRIMTKAITNAEKLAGESRAADSQKDIVEQMAGTATGSGSAIASNIATSGYRCPFIRQVVPIDGGNGIYQVVCADQAEGGTERGYRLDTRNGTALPETAPIA